MATRPPNGPQGPHDRRQPYEPPRIRPGRGPGHPQQPPPPQWQGDPSGPPPRLPRKRSRTALIVLSILGVCALLFVGCIALVVANTPDPDSTTGGGGVAPDERTTAGTKAPAATEPAAKAATLGQPARDGQFEFTVRKVDCTKRNIGGEYGENAQGVFCLVSMRVVNVGTEARTFDDSSQYAYDARGRRFATDGVAAIHLEQSNSFLEDINPGNAVDGIIVFDVPRGTRLARVELHDSAFSGGVEVRLA